MVEKPAVDKPDIESRNGRTENASFFIVPRLYRNMSPKFTRRRTLGLALATLAGCGAEPPDSGRREEDGGAGSPSEEAVDLSVEHDVTNWDAYDPEWTAPTESPEVELSVEVLIENLEIPWDLAFGADGELFVTERTGRLLRYQSGEIVDATEPRDAIDAEALPPGSDDSSWWLRGGEGGTMGTAVHPNYPDVPMVYVYYTTETDDDRVNRLVMIDITAGSPWEDATTLLEVPAEKYHNGGRIAFGPENYLWVTTGDGGQESLAADPGSLAGKILRLTPDGGPAPDNPDLGDEADPRVVTYGHRNSQGLSWLPDATPVISEHGGPPDEINLLRSGANYGWPSTRQPEEYVNSDHHPPVASSAIEESGWPPAGAVFYTGDSVPALRNRLLVGTLRTQRLKVFTLTPPDADTPPLGETGVRYEGEWLDDTYTVTGHDLLVDELGRIRHVEQGPNGDLYAITSNRDGRASGRFPTDSDDRLVRITQS
jgi:glucose/arabinose dehydrogenase